MLSFTVTKNNTSLSASRSTHATVGQEPESEATSSLSWQSEAIGTVNSPPEERTLDISNSNQILLPNYIRAPSTQRQCFFPGCNGTERLLVPSSLRVSLLCDYNNYMASDCRICSYHLNGSSWELLLESIYNPVKTFSSEQMAELLSLLKDNMVMHLDFETYSPCQIILFTII